MANPFIVGAPITTPQNFYGRSRLLSDFLDMTEGDLRCLRLIGLRRSGKTSFLRYLASDEFAGQLAKRAADPTLIVYVNLERDVNDPADFFRLVLDSVLEAAGNPVRAAPPVTDFTSFEGRIKELLRSTRLVILLDEFGLLVQNPKLRLTFFHSLRSLVSGRFAWLTTQRQLTLPGVSYFFNVFYSIPLFLGSLERNEACELFNKSCEKVKVGAPPGVADQIVDLGGTMPYLLQATADRWYCRYRGQPPDDRGANQIIHELLLPESQTALELESYWNNLDQGEREALRSCCVSAPLAETLVERLVNYGLLREGKSGPEPNGRLLSCWLTERWKTASSVTEVSGTQALKPCVFVSYCSFDALWLDRVLQFLRSNPKYDVWTDREMTDGEWSPKIEEAMQRARVAVLLISQNFLNSGFIMTRELPRLIQLEKEKRLVIKALLVKASRWKSDAMVEPLVVRPNRKKCLHQLRPAARDQELAIFADEVDRLMSSGPSNGTA